MTSESDAGAGTGRLVFRGGTVFDGTGSAPFLADVAISNGVIVEIGAGLAGDSSNDATGRTVLPGLIDCHAHPAFTVGFGTLDAAAALPPSYVTLQAIAGLRATLDAGVTTVRDAAGADAGLRRALADGLVAGPRLLVSLLQLSPSGGPADARMPSGLNARVDQPGGLPSPVADGPDALRAKVREFAQHGADVIKIFATGHFSMPRDGARRSMFTDAELAAIVDEAARQGLRVMAHAHGTAGATAAAEAGVASIEHGFYLDDVALDAMARAGTVLVPTLLASAGLLEMSDEAQAPGAREVVDGHRAVVREAHRRGIPIALGTDCPVTPHGRNAEELALMAHCGLSPFEALAAGTSVAARLLGLEAEIGRVAVGMQADLLVLEGDPADVAGFGGRLRDIYQRGRRVGPSAAGVGPATIAGVERRQAGPAG